MSTKNSKRILSVKLIHEQDDSPDTSYMGEYSDNPTSEYSIDRKHSLDCQINSHANDETIEKLERELAMAGTEQVASDFELEKNEREEEIEDEIEHLRECDCGLRWYPNNEHRYFNGSFNYLTDQGKPQDGLTSATVRKYVRQDYQRMEAFNAGEWCYLSIRALAEVKLNTDDRGIGVVQKIGSGGLWGIESDSDASYIKQIENDELADLKRELHAIGFSKRAISTAFKNVERSE